jgi:glycosyltransferase involved in cell wall biosynthesis
MLRAAITSVLNQTFHNFEIIVVDDASTDDTSKVVQAFNDKRIKYIRHESNRQEAGARNTGVRNAGGEYIGFLDDDDEWLPNKLEKQMELFAKSPEIVGGIYTGFVKIEKSTGKTIAQIIPSKRGDIFRDMISQNWVATPSTVVLRRKCFEQVGLFDENIVFGPDYDMWFRISKEFCFEYIPDPLVKYYVHDAKMSSNYDLMIRGGEARLKKHAEVFALEARSYSRHYLSLGVYYCHSGNMKKGRRAFLNAIRLYPFEIKHYYNFCLSLLGADIYRRIKDFRDTHLAAKKFESVRPATNR